MLSKSNGKKAKKRQRIVDSALALFNKQGFGKTTIENIISKAKVGKGTFYLYFKNKEQLVNDVMDTLVADLLGTLDWVTEENIGEDGGLRAIYRRQGLKMATIFIENRELAIFLYRQARAVSTNLDKKIQEVQDQLIGIATLYFSQAIERGDILPTLDPHITAMSVIGGINFAYQEWACGNVDLDVESIVEGLLTFYISALGIQE